ncbi:MAG: PHP domain-containing protein [Patescibacteria group bacterium]
MPGKEDGKGEPLRGYLLDPHVHTAEVSACGRIGGRRLAELYRKAGYDGIVVTDHYTPEFFKELGSCGWPRKIERFFAGYREAKRRGGEIGLDVLPGLELRLEGSWEDYLVYGADERSLAGAPDLTGLGPEGLHGFCAAHGLLVYQAHPFRPGMRTADPRCLDGVEVHNGNPRHESRNELALAFARRHGLRMLSGSDCHQPEDVGRGGIVLAEPARTAADLADLLRRGGILRVVGVP